VGPGILTGAEPENHPQDPGGEVARGAVRRYLNALNAHDADAIAACVAEDFWNEHTAVGGRDRHGRAEYRAALTGFLDDFRALRYEPEALISDGERVAVPYRMTFRHHPSAGAAVDVRGIFVFRVAPDGLIAHRTDYWDSGEVARQLADRSPG
jgi:steroid delta-isomerase-like uncharacterized protein